MVASQAWALMLLWLNRLTKFNHFRLICRLNFVVFILAMQGSKLFCQVEEEEKATVQHFLPWTIRFDGGLGFLTKPIAMKENFISVGDAGLASVWGIGKGFNLGIQMRYSGFQINPLSAKVYDSLIIAGKYEGEKPISTTYNLWSTGLYVSYDRFISPYSMFSFSLNPSISLIRYTKLRSLNSQAVKNLYGKYTSSDYNQTTFSIQPAVGFHYFFDENAGMSIKIGYTRTWSFFEPEKVRLGKEAIDYENNDLKGPVQFLSFCLGFDYSFKRIE